MSAVTSQVSDDEADLTSHRQDCPDIVVSCAPDSDDENSATSYNDEVAVVEQLSCAFDHLLSERAAATLDDVIGDVTRLRNVIEEGDFEEAISGEAVAEQCRQLVLDCRQLVSSVFYCSMSEMSANASRALHSLSILVRHTQNHRAPALLVSNVTRVVSAYEDTVVAAKEAVGNPRAGTTELAKFIRHASALARCLQLLLSNVSDVTTAS